jgi:uncharacterized protein DUF4154
MSASAQPACGVASLVDPGRRLLLRLIAAGALAGAAPPAPAQEPLESSVKAAYLYKFLGYVEWPGTSFPSIDDPQVIGVMGADAVLAELQQIVPGRRINGRGLVAKRVMPGDPIEGLHVLYIGGAANPSRVMHGLAGRPVLVVTDSPAGLAEGSALNFVLVDHRVRFEASPSAAERSGLKLSARLLAVAARVEGS